jgi:hypothetical protein
MLVAHYVLNRSYVTRRKSMSSRYEYIRKMQALLEEWNSGINRLTDKAGGYPADDRKSSVCRGSSGSGRPASQEWHEGSHLIGQVPFQRP